MNVDPFALEVQDLLKRINILDDLAEQAERQQLTARVEMLRKQQRNLQAQLNKLKAPAK